MVPTSLQPKKLLDIGQMMLHGEMPPLPLATLLGFHLTSIEPGQAVFEYEAAEGHANPMATLYFSP
jgi:acyl-coenzyme A thioesterase PaaI-like protein